VNVDCNAEATIGSILGRLKPGDIILVQGTCRENLLIQSEVLRITLDGQGKSTIDAPDPRRPAVQLLGREVTIKGFTVTGGTFGIAINRGATGTIDRNTIRNAAISGLEVSHNAFARIVNNTVERNQQQGILILGSASVHIGIIGTDDQIPGPISSRTMEGMASRCCAREAIRPVVGSEARSRDHRRSPGSLKVTYTEEAAADIVRFTMSSWSARSARPGRVRDDQLTVL
jgi:hypothetical protein